MKDRLVDGRWFNSPIDTDTRAYVPLDSREDEKNAKRSYWGGHNSLVGGTVVCVR